MVAIIIIDFYVKTAGAFQFYKEHMQKWSVIKKSSTFSNFFREIVCGLW